MPAITALQELKRDLIRKTLNGSVFVAPANADSIDETELFDGTSGDLLAAGLPDDYLDVGYLSDAGAAFARSISTSDVTSWQSKTPTRTDITADTTTLQLSCQETKMATLGLYLGVDNSDFVPGTNGVTRIDVADVADPIYYRVLSIAADETPDGEIVICRYLPNALVTNYDSQSFAKGDDPVLYPVTFTGYKDDTLGFSQSWIFGGAGWLAKLADMGFTSATPAAPTVTAVAPASLASAGGTLVKITGKGFSGVTGAASVKIAGSNATAYDVQDDRIIYATAPAHATGTALPVVVTNGVGASSGGATVDYV